MHVLFYSKKCDHSMTLLKELSPEIKQSIKFIEIENIPYDIPPGMTHVPAIIVDGQSLIQANECFEWIQSQSTLNSSIQGGSSRVGSSQPQPFSGEFQGGFQDEFQGNTLGSAFSQSNQQFNTRPHSGETYPRSGDLMADLEKMKSAREQMVPRAPRRV